MNKIIRSQMLFTLLLCVLFITPACSGKIDSIAITKAFPDATLSSLRSAFEESDFSFEPVGEYKGYELTTAVSPDGLACLQVLGTGEELQAARILIFIPIDATTDYANAQNDHLALLLNTVFGDSWPAEEWIYTATSAIASHSNASLRGGTSETTNYETDSGELPMSLYVRLTENDEGIVIAVVIGDWTKDIQFDPAQNSWDL